MRRRNIPSAWALAALLWAGPAFAHAHLISSTPADKATVSAPTEITMRFNGPLVGRVSAIKLMDAQGGDVAVTLTPAANATDIVARMDKPLAPGIYRATWTVAAENDGHRMSGNISFTVK